MLNDCFQKGNLPIPANKGLRFTRAGRTRKHGIRMVTTETAVEERQQHSKEGIAIEHGWSLSIGEGGREHVRVTEGPLWPLGSIYELHWYSLNKKKGFGGWAPGNLGN